MSEFTQNEMEGIVKAMSQKPLNKEAPTKVPLRPPGSYGKVAKVALSPLDGEKLRPLPKLTEKELSEFNYLKTNIEVVFGRTKLNLNELAALEEGSLLPLEDLCDDLVDIMVNGVKIGRGEIVSVDNHFAVKIVSFAKNPF